MSFHKPEVVVFDLGEVLSRPKDNLEHLAKRLSISPSQLSPGYWKWRFDYDLGLDAATYWGSVLADTPVTLSREEAEELSVIDSAAWAQLDDAELKILAELNEEGTRLVLLSNSPHVMDDIVRSTPWAAFFERIYISAPLGIAKPDPRIYNLVEDELNVLPENILFFDDRKENIDAANKRGWDAVLWTSLPAMEAELKQRGLLENLSESK